MQERYIRLFGGDDVRTFVRAASKCDFDIDVNYNHVYVDGKSILGVLGLDLNRILTVSYDGYNEEFEAVMDRFEKQAHSAA